MKRIEFTELWTNATEYGEGIFKEEMERMLEYAEQHEKVQGSKIPYLKKGLEICTERGWNMITIEEIKERF